METSNLQQRELELCEKYLEQFIEILAKDSKHTEVIRTGSRTCVYTVLDEELNERYIEISIVPPSDKRNCGHFDLNAEVEKYEREQREKSEIRQAQLAMKIAKKNRDKQIKKRFPHF